MRLDEQTIILLILLTPLPILFYLLKIGSTSLLLISGLLYLVLSVGAPLYLQARQMSTYEKARILLWLHMTDRKFTPDEQDIINKALGKDIRRPIRQKKTLLQKYWKIVFIVAIVSLVFMMFLYE